MQNEGKSENEVQAMRRYMATDLRNDEAKDHARMMELRKMRRASLLVAGTGGQGARARIWNEMQKISQRQALRAKTRRIMHEAAIAEGRK